MFRVEENIPEIYINKSRDYQLLCRLKDLSFNAVKYAIDSIRHTSNTHEINSSLLPLLKSKLGFFFEDKLTEDQLRYFLEGFPYLIRHKGSARSIIDAVNLWFRVYKIDARLNSIVIKNSKQYKEESTAVASDIPSQEAYTIYIYIDSSVKETTLLDQIFRYILPTGYIVRYMFSEFNVETDTYNLVSEYAGVTLTNDINSKVRVDEYSDIEDRLIGNVELTEIIETDSADLKIDKF